MCRDALPRTYSYQLQIWFSKWCMCMVFQGQNIVIGNVGDSRAVLATRDKDSSLIAIQLTVDLKPDLPGLSLSLLCAHMCAHTYTHSLPPPLLLTK